MIGSYRQNNSNTSSPKITMEMKTLFFTVSGEIETLPRFIVGSMRKDSLGEGVIITAGSDSPQGNVVLPIDISLVCLHGDVFCVELGSLGMLYGLLLLSLL